jgi:hypothetical protein
MRGMRTTLTLEDDLAGLLKRRAQDLGIPFREAVKWGDPRRIERFRHWLPRAGAEHDPASVDGAQFDAKTSGLAGRDPV